MKAKFIFIILILIYLLAGCGKSSNEKVISNNINQNVPYIEKQQMQQKTTEKETEKIVESTESTTKTVYNEQQQEKPSQSENKNVKNNEVKKNTSQSSPTKNNNKQLSDFTTYFNTSNTPRVNNIKIAGNAINDVIINSGEIFSYNETIGPTTKEKGYKKANVVSKGKEIKGYGGGVCQVSTTLFNAADKAGLEILERHSHSHAVEYVKKDRDAATSYGYIDMKFKNSKEYPIIIKCNVNKGSINVSIKKA